MPASAPPPHTPPPHTHHHPTPTTTHPPPPAPPQAGARMCSTLGDEFLPYLAVTMPALLAAAQLKADVVVRGDDDASDEDDADGEVREECFLGMGVGVCGLGARVCGLGARVKGAWRPLC